MKLGIGLNQKVIHLLIQLHIIDLMKVLVTLLILLITTTERLLGVSLEMLLGS